ncbi:TRAP transporter substrate-binding protein [Paracoccus jeotgali]|uniref:C4-dicarboxylate ABC transporter substrate-binding protein n=1 Tax=Paracoccus jeotgali TaxID=2065379 RepID=A0A2K9MCJ5_9RHOB|nr:TRAP transporter substrate-binding protein [Paracoccus jeotgali]AUM73344.1 C4-dicarboxylate ABC transporter substrate-binding protein [Paracoccus jeotgali]
MMGMVRVVLATAFVLASGAGGVAAQEHVFKLHHFLGAEATVQKHMLEPWARQVEENSGGQVRIDIYPSMTLGGRPPELVTQARDGVVDLIWTLNGYTPGVFPRTEVMELPFVYLNDPGAANLALADMYADHLAEDYRGLEPMFLHVHAGQAIQTVSEEVRLPQDLPGMKMRIPTRTGAWVIEALGAQPVSMPVPDLPLALSKGVVDGAFIPFEIIPTLKIQDQTQFQIEGADGIRFGTSVFQVSMNKARWDSLPPDVQQAFRDASGRDWLVEIGRVWKQAELDGIKAATDAGNIHVTLTPEETEAFREKLAPVIDRWVAEVTPLGIDGAGLVTQARDLVAKYRKETQAE